MLCALHPDLLCSVKQFYGAAFLIRNVTDNSGPEAISDDELARSGGYPRNLALVPRRILQLLLDLAKLAAGRVRQSLNRVLNRGDALIASLAIRKIVLRAIFCATRY